MADFIRPVLTWLVAVIESDTPALLAAAQLDAFAEVKQSWTGVAINWPPCSVMPGHSDFDPEGTAVHGAHAFTVKFGVCGDDSDQVAADAIGYMKAIDAAITGAAADWLPQMSRVFILRHDYGPLFQKDGSFAKFPELHLEVETQEL